MSDYFGFPNMANIPNPSEWKHADTAKDWAEKANNSAVLAKNYAEQIVESVDDIDAHVRQIDEHITDVTVEVLTAAQTATTKAAQAATSEANASSSAASASASATSASTSASSSADSATAANTYKNTAQSAATDATTSKTAAQTAATTATTKAAEAASSAIDAATAKSYAQQIAASVESFVEEAETYATNAQTYANAAGTHADEAETSAQLADTKATAATASANAAAASVTQAQQVVSTASAYASQAQTQATNAATSASAAATSATNAASSANAASISAESASTDADAASTFADSADSSADAAAASATTAEGHKDNAAASALSAQNFKVQASTFATNAYNSAASAAQSAAEAASSASSVNTNEYTEDHTPRYISETKALQEGYFILSGAQDGTTSNVVAYDSTQFVRLYKDATAIKQIINARTFLNDMKITRTAQNTLVCSDPYDSTVNTNWQYNSTKSPDSSIYDTTDTYRTVTYTMPTATTSTRTYRLGTTDTSRTKTCYCADSLPISGMAADTIYYTVDAAGTTITGRYNTNWTGNEADLQFDYYAKVYYDTLGSAAKLNNFKATETINFTGGFEYTYSNGCKFYWTSYSNNGIGRNRQLIDKLMITEEPGTAAREEYNIDNYKVSYYYTGESYGKDVQSFSGYACMSILIEAGLFRITSMDRNASTTIAVDFKDVCVCIPAENPITSVSIDSNVLASTDYTVISNKSRNFIIISSSQTGSVLAVNYTGNIISGASTGVLHKTTVKATNPTTKLFSANSALDAFNFRVKRDHRVRVHINLPYRDHMNDNDGFNHGVSGFGFSGGNFCPDSDRQYGSVNRYAGVGFGSCTNGDVGVSSFVGGPANYNYSYHKTINLSNGTTSTIDSYGTQMFGRLHTGWCSWVLPGFINVREPKSTSYTYNSAMMCRAYSKLFVPVAADLTEDSIPILDGLNNTMYNGQDIGNKCSNLSAYNSHNATRYSSYSCCDGPSKGHEAFKYYLIPGCLDVNGTTIKNPELPLYAGMQFWFTTNNASPTRTSSAHYFNSATDGIISCNPSCYSTSYLSSRLDYKSPNGSEYWHSNPLIGEAPGERNVFGNSSGFESRFLFHSEYNSTRYRTNTAGMHNTLGIRYFDAEAQEWRVFSPGDNCSYGYDGTHWNYREYLWVDLDKPVTFIVGGVNSSFQQSNYNTVDWSTYANLPAAQKAMPAANVYSVNSYGVPNNAAGLSTYKPKDDFAPGNKVSDLIHVKTPNYENYTSYSKWRKLTMMTVDYSSSPLNENNTIYCADSAFGAEDTGVLDMTKVSCMYGLHPSLASCHVINSVNSNLFQSTDSYYDPGLNLITGNSTNSIECNPLQYNTKLMVANNDGNVSNVSYGYGTSQDNLEHTCYHIRIGIES